MPDTRYPYQNFNPRSREGGDKGFQDTLKMIELFQSTLPRRERLSRLANALGVNVFQSTLPRRERPESIAVVTGYGSISIHAPAKGATMARVMRFAPHKFQSTLPRRERLQPRCNAVLTCDFNPRSREGSDYRCDADNPKPFGFQSTLPRRERLAYGIWLELAHEFQSTLPRRERQCPE